MTHSYLRARRACAPAGSFAATLATVTLVERFELAEAADRAGISPDELRGLVERGILQPDVAGRFTEGDVRRVGVVQSIVAAGIPIDLLADTLRSGGFSLAFMDDPAYSLFTSFTSETFQEVSARTGVPLNLLIAVRETAGGVTPAPGDRVRDGELPVVTPPRVPTGPRVPADHPRAQPASLRRQPASHRRDGW